jgi:hypothetical protein
MKLYIRSQMSAHNMSPCVRQGHKPDPVDEAVPSVCDASIRASQGLDLREPTLKEHGARTCLLCLHDAVGTVSRTLYQLPSSVALLRSA